MNTTIRAVSPDNIDTDGMVGEIVDGYLIKRRIASGGMGVVYEAIHEHLGRRYAIKMLHANLMRNPQIVSRFVAEGQRTNQIAIDGVVAVHHVGRTSGGVPFLVMDYIDGETLTTYRQRLFGKRERRLKLFRGLRATPSAGIVLNVLRLARQLVQTLGLIHEQGVVHRDLKPDNIFVVRDACVSGGSRVKVLDFGIAKSTGDNHAQPGQSFPWAPTFEPTVKGTTMGTPPYMPPEQWESSGTVHPKTDVYACGVIFYELMSGVTPFSSAYIGQLMDQHKTQKPTPLIAIEPWVPPRFSDLVDAMLRKNFHDRPDMPAVLATLDDILREQLALVQAAQVREGGVQTLFDGLFLSIRGAGAASRSGAGGRHLGDLSSFFSSGLDLLPWHRKRVRFWAVLFSVCCLLSLFLVARLTNTAGPERAGGGPEPPGPGCELLGGEFVVNTYPQGARLYLIADTDESLAGLLSPRCPTTPCRLSKEELRPPGVTLLIIKDRYRGLRLSADGVRRENYQILQRLRPLLPERPQASQRAALPVPGTVASVIAASRCRPSGIQG